MHRTRTSRIEHCSPMRAGGAVAIQLVLRAGKRDRREPGSFACHRRAISQDAFLRQSQDGRDVWRKSKACSTADAIDGHRGHLSQAPHDLAGRRSQSLSVLASRREDYSPESSLGHRHHVYPCKSRVFVPGGDHGLVQSIRAQLEVVQHAGRSFLPRSARRSAARETTGNIQQRPGLAIHGGCLYPPVGSAGRGDQHGRPRTRDRQHLHRTSMADGQVRGGLPERLRRCVGGGGQSRRVLSLLLARADPPSARLPNASRSLRSGQRGSLLRRDPADRKTEVEISRLTSADASR